MFGMFGNSWGFLWDADDSSWDANGANFSALRAILEPLGGSCVDLGASWDALGAPRRPPGGAHRFKERSESAQLEHLGTPPSQSL